MKILAFGASNSSTSINKQLAVFAAKQVHHRELTVLDLNDFEVSIFSPERRTTSGIPEKISEFVNHIENADLIIISFAEYNGSYTAAFKNIFDWATQVKNQLFENKKVFLMATSTGPRGGLSVLEAALNRFPRHGAEIAGNYLLPSFYLNFDKENGIIDPELLDSLNKKLNEI